MSDERKKAARAWMANRFREALESNFRSMIPTAMDAHIAGQEVGERSELEAVLAWIRAEYCFRDEEGKVFNRYGFVDAATLVNALERGEHREGR